MFDVTIKSFQSLYEVNFKVDGLTVIHGPSDLGKSSVLRALSSLFFGRRGKEFISYNSNETSVRIEFSEKEWVRWVKDKKSSQTYIASSSEMSEKTYTKLSNLSEVLELHKGFEVSFNPIDINGDKFFPQFQNQYDPLFLVSQSSQYCYNALLSLTSSDLLQGMYKECNKDYLKFSSEAKTQTEIINSIDIKIRSLDIKRFNNKMDLLLEDVDSLLELTEEFLEIKGYIDEINIHNKIMDSYKHVNMLIKRALIDMKDIEEISDITDYYERIYSIGYHIKSLMFINSTVNNIIETWAISIPSDEDVINLTSIENTHLKWISYINYIEQGNFVMDMMDNINKNVKELDIFSKDIEFFNSIRVLNSEIIAVKEERDKNSMKLKDIEEKEISIKEELGICPLCGVSFKNGDKNE